jgi:predicted 3-demethylubiquinone-9 3-methyltransferase (glyoxalase superfamily)
MQKITPCFWFDNNLEEALNFYASVFKDAKVKVTRVPGGPSGETVVGEITIFGQQFRALQGGPIFKFNEALSFYVNCENQEEVDYYWSALTANGGQESICGWLKDKYGLSWQITPKQIFPLLEDKDSKKVQRAMEVMMKMTKIEWKVMKDAFDGK